VTTNELAELVRTFVPEQPWSYTGNKPVPVEIQWDGDMWSVRFVAGLTGGDSPRRIWKRTQAPELGTALRQAYDIQRRRS